jgi:hypothetical protein
MMNSVPFEKFRGFDALTVPLSPMTMPTGAEGSGTFGLPWLPERGIFEYFYNSTR